MIIFLTIFYKIEKFQTFLEVKMFKIPVECAIIVDNNERTVLSKSKFWDVNLWNVNERNYEYKNIMTNPVKILNAKFLYTNSTENNLIVGYDNKDFPCVYNTYISPSILTYKIFYASLIITSTLLLGRYYKCPLLSKK